MDPSTSINGSARNFHIIAHRARTDGDFSLNDLCGAVGRLDGILRCINASLFLSHGMRRDTSVHAILLGAPDPPKVLSVSGRDVRYLNPDERSTASLVKRALSIHLGHEKGTSVVSTPGITITRGDLSYVVDILKGRLFVLDEGGADIGGSLVGSDTSGNGAPLHFFLSDDRDYSEEERALITGRAEGIISVSPLVLHADHAITVAHNFLDRSSSPLRSVH